MSLEVRPGVLLAGFRVESLIAEGAMGAVYRAEDCSTGAKVALKVLLPELASDERFRQRFLRETGIAASLDHPNIIPTVAAGKEDGVLYLAMLYVDGPDLRELLRREQELEPERAIRLVEQVAEALDSAHEAGLVHRDVKPGNILVTQEEKGEHAYVCDFGLARHVSSVSSLTGERGFIGTIAYVPPEQIEGGKIDGRADVYSLGCLLYECLAGTPPFARDSELSVVFAHLNEPPPRLSDERRDLPEAFDFVFATALAKAPNDRYATCGELAKAARAALAGKVLARRRVRRRRLAVGAAALLAAAVAIAAAVVTERGTSGSKHAQIPLAPNAVSLIDARSHHVVGSVPYHATKVVFAGRSAWLLSVEKQQLAHVDLRTRKVNRIVDFPWHPGTLATGAGSVWVAEDFGSRVWRIDAGSGKVARRLSVGDGGLSDVAFGAGSLWLAQGDAVLRVDPQDGHVLHRIAVPAQRLVFGDRAVWTATQGDGKLAKIDPAENRVVARQKLHGWLSDLAVGGGSLWASITPDGDVFRLSEDDLGVQSPLPAGPDPEQIDFGAGHLWVANSAAKAVSSLEQVSGRRRQIDTDSPPTTAAYHAGLVWTAASAKPKPLPPVAGQELHISTPTDTAVDLDPMDGKESVQQFMSATCANLLAYPDAAGAAGSVLRPEIAAAMPSISNGGRTYTFRIRRGFRFSPPSNEPVTALTFKHTLERSLSPKNVFSAGPFWVSDIAGVSAYRAGKAVHVSGISARGNTFSITLVRPAGDFLTRLSMFAFCPVPLSVPVHTKGFSSRPIPSAGPYYVASTDEHRTVLARNPNYHGDRPRKSVRIVYTNDLPTPQAATLANEGSVDVLPQDFDNTTPLLNPYDVLDQRFGAGSPAGRRGKQQYYLYGAPLTDYIVLNAGRPLFRDVRVRRAVNFAIDRAALGRAYGDAPADEIVPPAVPGYRVGSVYPLTRPDVGAARRLAGPSSHRGVLYWCGGDERQRTLAGIIHSDLARIGIRIRVDQAPQCPETYDARARRADLLLFSALGSQERDPQPFLEQALATDGHFGSALGPGVWTSRSFRRRLERARVLRGSARLRAYAALVAELTRAAPFAVYGSFVWSEYFSPHVGCKLFQGEYGFADLGALCKT